MCVCVCVCVCLCMYVCMYVCVYIYYTYIKIYVVRVWVREEVGTFSLSGWRARAAEQASMTPQ